MARRKEFFPTTLAGTGSIVVGAGMDDDHFGAHPLAVLNLIA